MTKLTCQEVLDQLWEYLDDASREDLRAKIDDHLGGCKDCMVEVTSLRQTISLYKCNETSGTPIQLSERIQAALQQAYGESEPKRD